MLAAAGIVSVTGVVLAGGFYLLSRPCVIGECTALANAKQLSENSAKTLKTSRVANSPQEAQEQLKQAIALLEPIPSWSIHRGEAQTALENYRQQSQNLNSAIDAARFAQSAAQKNKNPPYSAENWQESQALWQSAIAELGEIPTDSPVYPFAEEKDNRIPEEFSNWKSAVKAQRNKSRKNAAQPPEIQPK